MRAEDLRNYGKGLMDSVPEPKGLERWKAVRESIQKELHKELGVEGTEILNKETARLTKAMKGADWSLLREHGLVNGKYLESIIQRIAFMKALADMVGMKKATEIQCRLLDMSMYDLMVPLFPSTEEYKLCGDYFAAFKEYSKSTYAANIRAGLHEMTIIEDSPSVFVFRVTYCAWHEVAKAFGNPHLCYPSTCYGDDAYISRSLAGSGCQWGRSGTMATGAPFCEFRFEYNPSAAPATYHLSGHGAEHSEKASTLE
jgi:L-2-amino-thiazoline-4-carboxylic acid hydrolase